ncbi:MAG TPA: hypothetical protein VIK14_12760, partial [Ignavibacteria bacterium]
MDLSNKVKILKNEVNTTSWKENEINDNIDKIFEDWENIRINYPGWIVLPYKNRNELWFTTQRFMSLILNNFNKIISPNDILIIAELYWRYDKCLIPLSIRDEELIEKVLNKYNPFPTIIKTDKNVKEPRSEENKCLNWKNIKIAWLILYRILLSDARRDLNIEKFNSRLLVLEKFTKFETELYDFINYEKCLFYLSRFDENKLMKLINEWKIGDENTLYSARKASILAEIGEKKEASSIISKTLNIIRGQYKDESPNYFLMSLEGWAMMLYNYLNYGEKDELFDSRLEKLSKYRCDSQYEFDILQRELEKSEPSEKPKSEEIRHFDLNDITIRTNFSTYNFEEYFPAFSFLRVFEETCIPMSLKGIIYARDDIFSAANWIKRNLPIWSMSCVLRSNFDNAERLDDYINRFYVAILTEDKIERIIDNFLPSLEYSVANLQAHNRNIFFTIKSIQVIIDLLSKIVIRNIKSLKDRLFDIAINLYNNSITRTDDDLTNSITKLFKRLIDTETQSDLIDIIPRLLELPIENESGFNIKVHNYWKDPFTFIEFKDNTLITDEIKLKISNRVNELIKLIQNGQDVTRSQAIWRIAKLIQIKGLNEDQLLNFKNALYSRIDKYGIPQSNLLDHSYLLLPSNSDDLINIIKAKYLNSEIPK